MGNKRRTRLQHPSTGEATCLPAVPTLPGEGARESVSPQSAERRTAVCKLLLPPSIRQPAYQKLPSHLGVKTGARSLDLPPDEVWSPVSRSLTHSPGNEAGISVLHTQPRPHGQSRPDTLQPGSERLSPSNTAPVFSAPTIHFGDPSLPSRPTCLHSHPRVTCSGVSHHICARDLWDTFLSRNWSCWPMSPPQWPVATGPLMRVGCASLSPGSTGMRLWDRLAPEVSRPRQPQLTVLSLGSHRCPEGDLVVSAPITERYSEKKKD